MAASKNILWRLQPYHYVHVHDLNTNVTKLVVGPQTFARQDHEQVLFDPKSMVAIPPQSYCVIENPVMKREDGEVMFDKNKQVKLHFADQEIRLMQEPFPLYPGEKLIKGPIPLTVTKKNSALKLRALRDFTDRDGNRRIAGDEYLFEGPGTYLPRVEEEVVETVRATVIGPNQALRLVALKACTDGEGTERVTGEEWLVHRTGAYLPGPYEKVVSVVDAVVLTERNALHLEAVRTFTDSLGVERKSGDVWMITKEQEEHHIPHVCESVLGEVQIVSLDKGEFCVIENPVDDNGKQLLGQSKLVKGPKSFFLLPGESIANGIEEVTVLTEVDGLVLQAVNVYEDPESNITRYPGDKWLVRGPKEYVKPIEVSLLRRVKAITLSHNEGVYVRDVRSGKVRSVIGETYMLDWFEELWEKDIPPKTTSILTAYDPLCQRIKTGDKTRVVSFRIPPGGAVNIFDYSNGRERSAFGPGIVALAPDEQFTKITFFFLHVLLLKFFYALLRPFSRS